MLGKARSEAKKTKKKAVPPLLSCALFLHRSRPQHFLKGQQARADQPDVYLQLCGRFQFLLKRSNGIAFPGLEEPVAIVQEHSAGKLGLVALSGSVEADSYGEKVRRIIKVVQPSF